MMPTSGLCKHQVHTWFIHLHEVLTYWKKKKELVIAFLHVGVRFGGKAIFTYRAISPALILFKIGSHIAQAGFKLLIIPLQLSEYMVDCRCVPQHLPRLNLVISFVCVWSSFLYSNWCTLKILEPTFKAVNRDLAIQFFFYCCLTENSKSQRTRWLLRKNVMMANLKG